MPALSEYIEKFTKLRTDAGRDRYPAATRHRAPHKPFLLLSVMDLIAQGQIAANFIEPSFELVETWKGYWEAIMPAGHRSTMAYPFPKLQTDGFWHRIANPGYDENNDYNISSMPRLREVYAGARLDDALFLFLTDPLARERLRAALVEAYFIPKVQPVVREQGRVNLAAYEYARKVVGGLVKEETSPLPKVRDQGFRKAIVQLYDHRCALCGIRIRTPEGHTVVEAAHIVPWRESRDDAPANGLCLCRLCHWSFDEGLMAVGGEYEVLVSKRVRLHSNMPGHILTLEKRPIFKPDEKRFWPAQENLHRHRDQYFS